jgi:hypothetical protein
MMLYMTVDELIADVVADWRKNAPRLSRERID